VECGFFPHHRTHSPSLTTTALSRYPGGGATRTWHFFFLSFTSVSFSFSSAASPFPSASAFFLFFPLFVASSSGFSSQSSFSFLALPTFRSILVYSSPDPLSGVRTCPEGIQ
jgi:hypothetical protein